MPKKRILKEFKVNRVDIVRRGANRKRFHLFKGEDGMPNEFTDAEVEQTMEVIAKTPEGFDEDAMLTGIEKIEKSELSPEVRKTVVGAVRLLGASADTLPKGIKRMFKSLQDLAKGTNGKKADYDEITNPKKPEKLEVRKSDGSVDSAQLDDAMAALIKDDTLSPAVRELLSAVTDSNKTLTDSNKTLRKDVGVERDARLCKEYETKASEFDSLPLSKEDLASVLMWLSKDVNGESAEPVKRILGLFAGCNEMIKEAELTKELSPTIDPVSVDDPKTPVILKKAAEGEEELLKFVRANPRQYDQYVKDQRRRSLSV